MGIDSVLETELESDQENETGYGNVCTLPGDAKMNCGTCDMSQSEARSNLANNL